ncbi:anion permease [Bradymonadaceae bacterium TMQ3]|uniref:Phosphate transporter n=1 Tax=Lujinxingia sediminis TaxID=2480984 RepID=A0ABY0CUA3_9DELT|nr:inorganic phosphate transporter [Lujinxingia sediminis]RDV38539.1 anion permease [Bradymonadaceae bacterium TMQ3]RVU44914.1 inorganic phosphate transporter [Lujinxingia sediminis]TXC76693.1 inorganic phosphate transporter [Bradymonadales bacterium TMQ1]
MGVELILWVAIAFGFYMAWSIGANDAANAMGTSVGSKAISFKEAVIIAAIFEFSGAFIAGASVTDTMRRGIIDPLLFNDAAVVGTAEGSTLFMLGMLAALISAAVWLHLAAMLGWPVSTTHSIVGAITGFGLVAVGPAYIQWGTLAKIVSSWAVSPLTGGILAYLVFSLVRKMIFDAENPVAAVKRWSPVLVFPVFLVLGLVIFVKGMPGVDLESYGIGTTEIWLLSALVGVVGSLVSWLFVRTIEEPSGDDRDLHVARVEKVFRYLQIATACFVAFAHGSNDVANSIGPLAAIVGTFNEGAITAKVPVPTWVLLLGGLGIVIGLATYGYKVIETIGTKITEITPSRGFAAEFGAASTILMGSWLGLPISTTHTVVGAVIGVGFARGMTALNLGIIWNIVKSWVYTLPVAGGSTILIYVSLKAAYSTFIAPL